MDSPSPPGAAIAPYTPPPSAMALPFRVPRPLRVLSMASLFALFFVFSPLMALVLFPALRLTSRDRYRARCTYLLHRGMRFIAWTARALGIVGLDLPPMPASVDPASPHILVSNHPTYIDMIVVLGTFEHLTCVTNGRWWKHWALGRLLRSTLYLPGPGSGLPESEDMLESMVAHLRSGHPLLVFPEGQRSKPTGLRRFRRGAFEAAVRADVPIVPLFLRIDQPYLTKNVSIWRAPQRPPTYTFEWLDVVRPADFDHDAKRIARHLEEAYKARFAALLATW